MHFSKKKKKRKTTCSFQIGTKNPTKKKIIVEPSFFTSWTMTSEKCTRAHVQENKSIYIYLYISPYENVFENGCIYIYIYIYINIGNRKKTTLSSRQACFMIAHFSGDLMIRIFKTTSYILLDYIVGENLNLNI